MRRNIFISHVSTDKDLANTLKSILENTFARDCDVFASSSPDDIYGGVEWHEIIRNKLAAADLLIVLCSVVSLKSPWISYEVGCATTSKIPIIPLWYGGLCIHETPTFITKYQGYFLDNDSNVLEKLVQAIREQFGITRVDKNGLGRCAKQIAQLADLAINHQKQGALCSRVHTKFRPWALEINKLLSKLTEDSTVSIMSWLSTFALSRHPQTYEALNEKVNSCCNLDIRWIIGNSSEAEKFFRGIIRNYTHANRHEILTEANKSEIASYIDANIQFIERLSGMSNVTVKCAGNIPFHYFGFKYRNSSVAAFDLSEVGDVERDDWRFSTSSELPIRGFIVDDNELISGLEWRFDGLFLSRDKSKALNVDEYAATLNRIKAELVLE